MAKVSKRKRPPRSVKVFKERIKTEGYVFDRFTLLTLSKFFSQGIIKTLDFPIKSGKESVVFRATAHDDYPSDYLAVKIYMIETSDFVHMRDYISGDPRFEVKKNRRKLVYEWVKKEYRNLLLCEQMSVLAPHPHIFKNNVLIMDYIGDSHTPAPTLKEHGPFDPKRDYEFLMQEIEKMYKNGFVHADLSEYNILCGPDGKLYLIDLAQGVLKDHPKFDEWHQRDVQNIKRFFSKYGICGLE